MKRHFYCLWVLLFFQSFQLRANTSPVLPIISILDEQNYLSTDQELKLKSKVLATAQFYHQELNFLPPEIKISVEPSGGGCFRTGYNFVEKVLLFCQKNDVINMGIENDDIINHELFHYLYCHQFPKNCEKDFIKIVENEAIHEGLADYFSYLLNPDLYFGENFKVGTPYLRQYQNDYCFKLTQTPHLKGNSLTSFILREGLDFALLKNFLISFDLNDLGKDQCFDELLNPVIEPIGRDASRLNKYWLQKNETIEFQVNLSHLYQDVQFIPYDPLQKFAFYQSLNDRLVFMAKDEPGIEVIYLMLKKDGKDIGVLKLLLGIRK